MAKFDAATAVDALEIDWSKYGGPVGILPEPSTARINRFQNSLREAARKLGLTPGKTPNLDDIADLPDDAAEQMAASLQGAVVDLCGGFITAEDYDKLPFRVQAAFTAWIAGELRPEAPTPGTKR